MSRTVSTSSSSLSECPLESEILKSFADAQELPRNIPFFKNKLINNSKNKLIEIKFDHWNKSLLTMVIQIFLSDFDSYKIYNE